MWAGRGAHPPFMTGGELPGKLANAGLSGGHGELLRGSRGASGITALVGFVVLLAAACSSGPAVNTGPLGDGGTSGSLCVPLHPGEALSYGVTVLSNIGTSPARLRRHLGPRG
jgi:hypothetical protein